VSFHNDEWWSFSPEIRRQSAEDGGNEEVCFLLRQQELKLSVQSC